MFGAESKTKLGKNRRKKLQSPRKDWSSVPLLDYLSFRVDSVSEGAKYRKLGLIT